jgi:alkanesulfonate monooxygenase SsuD/methylene tetrahydromethanopterin reductase-like flavin-dependent oxidoreductase (luciferase family)
MAPGRIILGLGAGWHEPEFAAFDLPFERKVSRLTEYVPIVSRLLTGERFSQEGDFYTLRDASIITTAAAPPVWVAASGPRMLDLTARHADGWNVAWMTAGTEHFIAQKRLMDEARRRAGRQRPLTVSVGLLASADGDRLASTLRDYEKAGADHVILNFSPQPFLAFDDEALKRAAPALTGSSS